LVGVRSRSWCRSEEGRTHSLIITKLGRTAIKAEDDRALEDADSVVPGAASTDKAAAQSERSAPRHGSKLSIVIDLLARKRGVGIEELASAVGWLPHTTRAALAGLPCPGVYCSGQQA
jgi:hypothetical protein